MPNIPIESRLKQLEVALKTLKYSNERFQSGSENKQGEIIIMASQVRALICKGNGRNFHPLLIEVAKEKKIDLICFAPQDLKKLPPILKESCFLLRPEIIGINPRERWVRYYFEDWLDSEIIIIGNEIYTPNEILRLKADSEASHYDSKISQKLKGLKEIEKVPENIQLIDDYILQTVGVILWLGHFVLNPNPGIVEILN
ncbi:MAG: hypothetical protein ACD_11C00004G0004 [uncultured bacterium]|nr:MAG: hypothetical protein ACD_11C00004G0004 [uncultured bacterium]HBR72117.1 hypothetical protein [Candidatus Moranbacteria bacterium]